jgi:hypothetical protein
MKGSAGVQKMAGRVKWKARKQQWPKNDEGCRCGDTWCAHYAKGSCWLDFIIWNEVSRPSREKIMKIVSTKEFRKYWLSVFPENRLKGVKPCFHVSCGYKVHQLKRYLNALPRCVYLDRKPEFMTKHYLMNMVGWSSILQIDEQSKDREDETSVILRVIEKLGGESRGAEWKDIADAAKEIHIGKKRLKEICEDLLCSGEIYESSLMRFVRVSDVSIDVGESSRQIMMRLFP